MLLLIVIGQSLAIYLFLVVALGRLGPARRAELTSFDYLIVALLGSAVETCLYRGSGSLAAGLVSAATLIGADHVTTALMNKCPRLRRWLVGTAVVLVKNGEAITSQLQRVRMTEEDLRAALRKRGYDRYDNVRLAVLEVDGAVGVIPKEQGGAGR